VKVLILNLDSVGEGLTLAIRAVKAGHTVRLYLAPDNNPTTGEGFKGVERVKNWLGSVKWADLVIPTGNHEFMPKLDALRKAGIRVFGPSVASANLEVQRAQGMKFFEDAGIEVPEYQQFASLKEAEAHVRKTEDRYVFKTLGDEDDKSLSYVGKTPADMIARLQRWQKLGMNPKGKVMLQEFVGGVEVGVSCWMGSDGFIGKANENFEFKKLLSGNCGPNCGEAGTVMKYVDKSKLADEVLYPLEDELVKLGHLGDIDVNCIVDEAGKAWPLEFTCRLGWPAANIMWATHKGDPIQWMYDACDGKDTLEASPQVACGIVIAQPDYPYSKKTKAETDGIPIYGVSKDNQKYLSPQAVKIVTQPNMDGEKVTDKSTWTTTGDYICVVTALGKTIKQSCERAYKTVKELHIPDMIYRDDIGEKLEKELPELQKHGYVTEFSY
jgi:phosphoribosylamine---glycine ligase